jgi:hypothetical protein
MALSKQDYIEQGIEAAHLATARSPGKEDIMPVYGMGNSWQAKAFAEGFRQGVTARHERNNGLQKGEAVVMKSSTNLGKSMLSVLNNQKQAQSARETAAHHLDGLYIELGKASASANHNRAGRIMRKVEKIQAKWGL